MLRKGGIVSKNRTVWAGRRGIANNHADLMKRDGGFHISEIEVIRRRTKSKIEVSNRRYKVEFGDVQMETDRKVRCPLYWKQCNAKDTYRSFVARPQGEIFKSLP
jgi:hypothetical protein